MKRAGSRYERGLFPAEAHRQANSRSIVRAVNTVIVTDEQPAAAFLYVLADERLNVVGQAYSGTEVLPLLDQLDPDVVVLIRSCPALTASAA
jgi:AmiR/NasT family two-component response regulator